MQHRRKKEVVLEIDIRKKFLILGGVISAFTAVWHLLMIVGGPTWYAFARAPIYIVESAQEGTLLAPTSAIAIAVLMFICSVYSFSGAGLMRKIPLLMPALVIISIICLARGLYVLPLFFSMEILGIWHLVASSIWLFVGMCFLMGFSASVSQRDLDATHAAG